MDRTVFQLRALLFVALFGLSACSALQRSPRSGYAEEDLGPSASATDFYREKKAWEEEQTLEEFGWSTDRPLSEAEKSQLNDRLHLRRLESRLENKREKKQYFQLKSAMRSDRERAYFLTLPSVEARERWAQNRGLASSEENPSEETATLIEKNDIAVGMSAKAVTESWGDPDAIEVAGDPVYGNERWRYSRFVSSSEGYDKQTRIVYFEAGRVVGWESH